MEPPEGLDLILDAKEAKRHQLLRLNKALYGLKQAPLEWYRAIGSYLKEIGFEASYNRSQPLSPYRTEPNYYYTSMIVVLMSKNLHTLKQRKRELMARYRMTDLGEIGVFLGIEVERNRPLRQLRIHQKAYLERVLQRFQMSDCNGTQTPIQKDKVQQANQGEPVDSSSHEWYRSVVGSLMYAMVCTRPDLAFTLSRLSKYVSNPSLEHLAAAKQALRYVRSTTGSGIAYGRASDSVGYSDADHARDWDSRKSTSGFVFVLHGGAISWRSKLQGLVTCSTLEAEFVAASEASNEMIWLDRLLKDLDKRLSAKRLYCDNQGAVELAHNGNFSNKSKQIDTRKYHIKDSVETRARSTFSTRRTELMVADILTKPLSKDKHQEFSAAMGMGRSTRSTVIAEEGPRSLYIDTLSFQL